MKSVSILQQAQALVRRARTELPREFPTQWVDILLRVADSDSVQGMFCRLRQIVFGAFRSSGLPLPTYEASARHEASRHAAVHSSGIKLLQSTAADVPPGTQPSFAFAPQVQGAPEDFSSKAVTADMRVVDEVVDDNSALLSKSSSRSEPQPQKSTSLNSSSNGFPSGHFEMLRQQILSQPYRSVGPMMMPVQGQSMPIQGGHPGSSYPRADSRDGALQVQPFYAAAHAPAMSMPPSNQYARSQAPHPHFVKPNSTGPQQVSFNSNKRLRHV